MTEDKAINIAKYWAKKAKIKLPIKIKIGDVSEGSCSESMEESGKWIIFLRLERDDKELEKDIKCELVRCKMRKGEEGLRTLQEILKDVLYKSDIIKIESGFTEIEETFADALERKFGRFK